MPILFIDAEYAPLQGNHRTYVRCMYRTVDSYVWVLFLANIYSNVERFAIFVVLSTLFRSVLSVLLPFFFSVVVIYYEDSIFVFCCFLYVGSHSHPFPSISLCAVVWARNSVVFYISTFYVPTLGYCVSPQQNCLPDP